MNIIIEYIKTNWSCISDLLIILVGLSAVWIYKAQEKGKIKDAASLVILQIDELQTRVREIQSYITEKGLNFGAFYESLPLIDTNYWDKYKHYLQSEYLFQSMRFASPCDDKSVVAVPC